MTPIHRENGMEGDSAAEMRGRVSSQALYQAAERLSDGPFCSVNTVMMWALRLTPGRKVSQRC